MRGKNVLPVRHKSFMSIFENRRLLWGASLAGYFLNELFVNESIKIQRREITTARHFVQ